MVDIFKLDTPAETETKEKHKKDILLIVDYLNTYVAGFSTLGAIPKNKDEEQKVWLLMLVRSFHAIICASRLAISGYYAQSVALICQVTENWLVCENSGDELVRNYVLRGEGERPNYYDLAYRTGNLKIYDSDYRFECKLAHPSVLSLSILTDLKDNSLRVFPTYDEHLFLACVEGLFRKGLLIGEYMYKYISYRKGEKVAKEWDRSSTSDVKRVSSWLEELRERYKDEINQD